MIAKITLKWENGKEILVLNCVWLKGIQKKKKKKLRTKKNAHTWAINDQYIFKYLLDIQISVQYIEQNTTKKKKTTKKRKKFKITQWLTRFYFSLDFFEKNYCTLFTCRRLYDNWMPSRYSLWFVTVVFGLIVIVLMVVWLLYSRLLGFGFSFGFGMLF